MAEQAEQTEQLVLGVEPPPGPPVAASSSSDMATEIVDATVVHDDFVDHVRYEVDPVADSIVATDQLGAELLCR